MAIQKNQPMVTRKVTTNGKRRTSHIPINQVSCQWYKDAVAGDYDIDGNIITQSDIDNDVVGKIGFNCGSPVVSWMRDIPDFSRFFSNSIAGQYYLNNPNANPVEDYSIDDDGNLVWPETVNPGDPGPIAEGCWDACWTNGTAACQECYGGTGGGGGGEVYGCTDPDANNYNPNATVDNGTCQYGQSFNEDWIISYRCCAIINNQQTHHPNSNESPAEWGNQSVDACNAYDCGCNGYNNFTNCGNEPDGATVYYHDERVCRYPIGTFGAHNIVYNFYDYEQKQTSLPSSNNNQEFWPLYNNNVGSSGERMYYNPTQNPEQDFYWSTGNWGPNTDVDTEGWTGPTNNMYDRYQTGINNEGQLLYDFPAIITSHDSSCDTLYPAGGDGMTYNPSAWDYAGNYEALSYSNARSNIRWCPDPNSYISNLLFAESTAFYISQFVTDQNSDFLLSENLDYNFTIPGTQGHGWGLEWLGIGNVDWGGFSDDDWWNYPQNWGAIGNVALRDVVHRLGLPLPPLMLGGEDNPDCTSDITVKYESLLNEFFQFVGITTFFADFDIPGVDIVPTMNSDLDIKSGIDLRYDRVNGCSHIEVMVLPGTPPGAPYNDAVIPQSEGDGIFYTIPELTEADALGIHPGFYLWSVHDTQYTYSNNADYIRGLTCETQFNRHLRFNVIRAVCKDGSHVQIGQSWSEGSTDGVGGNDTTHTDYPLDYQYFSGIEACNSRIRYRTSQDLYYLSNGDLREPLGMFFFDSENLTPNNFISNITDDTFKQYPITNLLRNGNGRVDSGKWGLDPDGDGFNNLGVNAWAPLSTPDLYPYVGKDQHWDGNPYLPENWFPISKHSTETAEFPGGHWAPQWKPPLYYYGENSAGNPEKANIDGMLPYWSSNNTECYSFNKCLIIDTTEHVGEQGSIAVADQSGGDTLAGYDYRQGITTFIHSSDLTTEQKWVNNTYKLSFLMKTMELINDDVELKNTGVHIFVTFNNEPIYDRVYQNFNMEELNKSIKPGSNSQCSVNSHLHGGASTVATTQHFGEYANAHNGLNDPDDPRPGRLTSDSYCNQGRASFTNTAMGEWQKMEFTFQPGEFNFNNHSDGGLKITIVPLQIGRANAEFTGDYFEEVNGSVGYIPPGQGVSSFCGNWGMTDWWKRDDPNGQGMASWSSGEYYYHLPPYRGARYWNSPNPDFTNLGSKFYVGGFCGDASDGFEGGREAVDIEAHGAKIYLDNFEFTEAFDFHPDVDVRKKKGRNDYGKVSLTEYYDWKKPTANPEEFFDTRAPLEAQFYFYARVHREDVFAYDRELLGEQFNYRQFYVHNIDWGDGSPEEFTTEPKQLGPNIMLYHTYENAGIYEIKGTMFVTKPEEYYFNAEVSDRIEYIGNVGVGHHKNFTLRINVNEGRDEDFTYFGSDGFSLLPFKNTTPIVGGISNQSTYYKNLKRNLGIVDSLLPENFGDAPEGYCFSTITGESSPCFEDSDCDNIGGQLDGVCIFLNQPELDTLDINYEKFYDRLMVEHALSKMDSSYDNVLNLLNNYRQPLSITFNTSSEYLATLPFPIYYDEFDVGDWNGVIPGGNGTISENDAYIWETEYGRPDIKNHILEYILTEPVNFPEFSYDGGASIQNFINPTLPIFNNEWTGLMYSELREELGKSLGDTDISNIKYYNKPKGIWEILGFTLDELQKEIIDFTTPNLGNGIWHSSSPSFTNDLNAEDVLNSIGLWRASDSGEDFLVPVMNFGDASYIALGSNIITIMNNANGGPISNGYEYTENGPKFRISTQAGSYLIFTINNQSPLGSSPNDEGIDMAPTIFEITVNDFYLVDNESYSDDSETSFTLGAEIILRDLSHTDVLIETSRLHPGNPASPRYWKNIIPEDYNIFNRHGLIFNDNQLTINNFLIGNGHMTFLGQEVPALTEPSWLTDDGPTIYDGYNGLLGHMILKSTIQISGHNNDIHLQIPQLMINGNPYPNPASGGTPWPMFRDNLVYWNLPDTPGNDLFSLFGNQEEEARQNINGVVGQGVASAYVNGNWVGMVPNLENGKFYQFVVDEEYTGKLDLSFLGNPITFLNSNIDFEQLQGEPIGEFRNTINIYSEQQWIGTNPYGNTYYYPVLPKHGLDGKFIEGEYTDGNIPFPINGPITDQEDNNDLLIKIDSQKVESGVFEDSSGNNNKAFEISDFKPDFDSKTFEVKQRKSFNRIKTTTKGRAY